MNRTTAVSLDQARAAKEKAEAAFAPMAVVVGIGIARSEGGYCLKINLCEAPEGRAFPDSIDGVPVRLEVVGAIGKR